MNKICFFIGHRDTPQDVFPRLEAAVERHICKCGVAEFVVGNRGNFDRMAAQAVIAARRRHPHVRLTLLLAYHPAQRAQAIPAGFDDMLYPFDRAEHPRTAIVKANRRMIESCGFLIAYASYVGNARTLLEYARGREKKGLICVENLAGSESEGPSAAARMDAEGGGGLFSGNRR